MSQIIKEMFVETKQNDDDTMTFIGSTEDIDRDGEVIRASGWDLKNFKKNPVVLFGHNHFALPIGKSLETWVDDDKLKFKVKFASEEANPLAGSVKKLIKEGIIKSTSVGFIPKKWEDGDTQDPKGPRRIYTKQELLELSIVPIPANPNAVLTSKAFGQALAENKISNKDMEILDKALTQIKEMKEKGIYEEVVLEEKETDIELLKGLFQAIKEQDESQIKLYRAFEARLERIEKLLEDILDKDNPYDYLLNAPDSHFDHTSEEKEDDELVKVLEQMKGKKDD